MLKGASFNQYGDDSAWHNMFRTQVVERVNELLFKPLYDETMGAPNSSIRVLIGVMALFLQSEIYYRKEAAKGLLYSITMPSFLICF